ncbi:hypothetical protein ACOME3_001360 [Neoechinorhynchus agilis]
MYRQFTFKLNQFKRNKVSPFLNIFTEVVIEILSSLGIRAVTLIGPLLVVIAVGLIGLTVYVFYAEVLPFLYQQIHIFKFATIIVMGHWLLVNIAFNYYMAIQTDPGYPRKCLRPFDPAFKDPSICIDSLVYLMGESRRG